MGNPHAVMFVEDLDQIDMERVGSHLATHPEFPKGCNVEVVEIVSRTEARVMVWERGVGFSFACGTGACAVVVAGVLTDVLDPQVTVQLPGGALQIDWQGKGQKILMTGPAKTVFKGQLQI